MLLLKALKQEETYRVGYRVGSVDCHDKPCPEGELHFNLAKMLTNNIPACALILPQVVIVATSDVDGPIWRGSEVEGHTESMAAPQELWLRTGHVYTDCFTFLKPEGCKALFCNVVSSGT
eukprot:1160628-Pelagomonas_calceolata.AAC.5